MSRVIWPNPLRKIASSKQRAHFEQSVDAPVAAAAQGTKTPALPQVAAGKALSHTGR